MNTNKTLDAWISNQVLVICVFKRARKRHQQPAQIFFTPAAAYTPSLPFRLPSVVFSLPRATSRLSHLLLLVASCQTMRTERCWNYRWNASRNASN